jgi:hypothetical protein
MSEDIAVIKIPLFDAYEALNAARAKTVAAWVRRRFWLSDFDAEIDIEIPVRVFFSEKHRVALILPSEAKFNAGELIIGGKISPREFRYQVEIRVARFVYPTQFRDPLIIPLGCDVHVRAMVGGRRVLERPSRFDAGEIYFINVERRIVYHEYWNKRTGMCSKHLILYNATHNVSDIARAMYKVLWMTNDFLLKDVEKAVEATLRAAR